MKGGLRCPPEYCIPPQLKMAPTNRKSPAPRITPKDPLLIVTRDRALRYLSPPLPKGARCYAILYGHPCVGPDRTGRLSQSVYYLTDITRALSVSSSDAHTVCLIDLMIRSKRTALDSHAQGANFVLAQTEHAVGAKRVMDTCVIGEHVNFCRECSVRSHCNSQTEFSTLRSTDTRQV